MKLSCKTKRSGFTLVELLVVIVIIAALAGLSFTVLPRMMRKSKVTDSMSKLRQFAPLLQGYATDHSNIFPAIEGNEVEINGVKTTDLNWTEVVLSQLYPDVDASQFKNKSWWDKNKPFMQNPLFATWTPEKPGFAFNEMVPTNIQNANKGSDSVEPLKATIPGAAIQEANRTPMVAPFDDYKYSLKTQGDAKKYAKGTLNDLTTDGRIMILFFDGHVDTIAPTDYVTKKYYELPVDESKRN